MDNFRDCLENGVTLFNRGDYPAAYELWCTRWSEEDDPDSDLLQGLLQVAFGFSKLQDGEERAALKLISSAMRKLSPYAPQAWGLDVKRLLESLEAWQSCIESSLRGDEPSRIRQGPQIERGGELS